MGQYWVQFNTTLKDRLDATRGARLLPQVTYSSVSFSTGVESTWSSPWGQAYTLLKGIAEFPRSVLSDPFFLRGVKTNERDLVEAMNVSGDHLVSIFDTHQAKVTAETELKWIQQLDQSSISAQEKCRILISLIKKGEMDEDFLGTGSW
jgi:hypothetical protein